MASSKESGKITRLPKQTPVDDLKSLQALKLNDEIVRTQQEYTQAQAAVKACESTLKDDPSICELTKLQSNEQKAYERLLSSIKAKRDYISSIYERIKTITEGASKDDITDTPKTTKVGKTELSLVMAALNDIDSKLMDLEGRKNIKTSPRKRTAIQKNKLEEGIAAVLAEASKTKKEDIILNKIKQEAVKVEDKKKNITTEQAGKASELGRYRLIQIYKDTVVPAMMKQFNYKNVNQVPKIDKIVLNMGLGDIKDDSKKFNIAVDELKTISGQKPIVAKAKKSVANFKLREGMNVGAKVTLRNKQMYEFLDKLISIALPRVRDFRGINPKSFDGRGNYALGIKEQLIFPEIRYDQIDKIRGFDVVIVTTAKTDEEAKALLTYIGMPFKS